jgi:hypothetical protein
MDKANAAGHFDNDPAFLNNQSHLLNKLWIIILLAKLQDDIRVAALSLNWLTR